MLRFLLWRLLGLLALAAALVLVVWLLHGGPGEALRGHASAHPLRLGPAALADALATGAGWLLDGASALAHGPGLPLAAGALAVALALALARAHARASRRYVRVGVHAYRGDHAEPAVIAAMFASVHKRLQQRWWRRLLHGQPSMSLEIHHEGGEARVSWLALCCQTGCERALESALRAAYPNCRLGEPERAVRAAPVVLRLKKRSSFIERVASSYDLEFRAQVPADRLLTAMGAVGEPAFVQLALTPAPVLLESLARHLYKRREAQISRERREHAVMRDRSLVEDAELRGGLEVQHEPLFFCELRVVGSSRASCEQIASELRADRAENQLVERGTAVRHGLLGLYERRVLRGEGNPLPSFRKGVLAPGELAAIWQLPSVDYATVPLRRTGVPLAPASPDILRPANGHGSLRDALGAVSVHEAMRKQNTAVPGTVEQGKTSFLVATVAEDVRRERCAVIVFDPKGDAADGALSVVPSERTCTLLDFARPTCGFNPLAVDAPADVIADYAVGALKTLFTDADIRASSDRYLRNAIIAVLAYDRGATLWDAARLLSVGEEGYAFRARVGSRVRELPELREISEFFTAELSAQLADARSTTTAKLDAPVNKLARLLNSPSIKRVLRNDSLTVDFDRIIAGGEVLVVRGALGAMGAGNTSVLMQLLVGMLDAALARQQDLVPAECRVAVALKVDEAPLVINRGFAETMALKRSAGLETVACWQTDSQWTEREVREQLDALFAHRVYFATASVPDAREAARLAMAEFSDTVRPGLQRLSSLGRPDVRLHLPKHHAVVSWVTPAGRQPAFVAETIPISVDRERLAAHAASQRERGGRALTDLSQPHWQREERAAEESLRAGGAPAAAAPSNVATANGSAASGSAPSGQPAPSGPAPSGPTPAPAPPEMALARLPELAAESYGELVELDGAHSFRRARRPSHPCELAPDAQDVRMLELMAALEHVLTSQLHRRFNRGRSPSTTQRRLKRLADAGLLDRLQFHRKDGGGIPMCNTLAPAGARLLAEREGARGEARQESRVAQTERGRTRGAHGSDERAALRQVRHDVHVGGWVLALLAALAPDARTSVRGGERAAIAPPGRTGAEGWQALGPAGLRLPAGRAPHDFVRTDGEGARVEVERFETVRPDAIVEVSQPARACATDLLVELEDRPAGSARARKLERYDHFLAGWSLHIARYGRAGRALPVVVFVCRDRARARECARGADAVLRAGRAYAGERPSEWEFPGRERTAFVAERDVHEGLLCGYGVPRLPPQIRVSQAGGDPRAGEARVLALEIPGLDGLARTERAPAARDANGREEC